LAIRHWLGDSFAASYDRPNWMGAAPASCSRISRRAWQSLRRWAFHCNLQSGMPGAWTPGWRIVEQPDGWSKCNVNVDLFYENFTLSVTVDICFDGNDGGIIAPALLWYVLVHSTSIRSSPHSASLCHGIVCVDPWVKSMNETKTGGERPAKPPSHQKRNGAPPTTHAVNRKGKVHPQTDGHSDEDEKQHKKPFKWTPLKVIGLVVIASILQMAGVRIQWWVIVVTGFSMSFAKLAAAVPIMPNCACGI